jgi:hypothetical protein
VKFLVSFPQPVRYLPGHPKGRTVRELPVNADTAEQAMLHAIRTVEGDVSGLVVTPR